MIYSDLIKQEGEYTYSVNVQFDIENDRKLLRFIPNETTIELLREFFVDMTRSEPGNHARILYGSYGTGKSHFLTVLSLLLGKQFVDGVAFDTFIQRIGDCDEHLSNDIIEYVKNKDKKPFLIIPIVFDFEDFDRCIYFSLKKKLESIGIKANFKTFYDQAFSLLKQWEEQEDSNNRLLDICEELKIDLKKLENKLIMMSADSETLFQAIFSKMTYGVKFVHEVSNLSETLKQVNQVIEDKYQGMVFIFDEFGRYIEDNIKSIKVKAIQSLAEFCDHGGMNNHIILVSHREIAQYTEKYNKTLVSEWKKVEGRYKPIPINDRQDQCLSLIRNVLIKDKEIWESFKKKFSKELGDMYSDAMDFRGFLIDASNGVAPFEGGFPLHPISLYALDKLSKKVAQNERTFFTYLASKEEHSLYRFLIKHDLNQFHFVGIDEIYDYFEPNIKAVQSDSSYEWYKNLHIALSKNQSRIDESTPEVKILKVIATIGIINDASTLVANKATITSVINYPKDIVEHALESLCEKKILKYSGAYNRYEFFEASIFDVETMLEEEAVHVKEEIVTKTLNEKFVNFVLYPYQYNREYKINRVFVPVFATSSVFDKRYFNSMLSKADGLLVLLLSDNEVTEEALKKYSSDLPRSIVVANNDVQRLREAVKKYVAVGYLESRKEEYVKKDPSFAKELAFYKSELTSEVRKFIEAWKNRYDSNIEVWADGEPAKVLNHEDLSDLASHIMYTVYPSTLIVNNELINKNTVSPTLASARKNVLKAILAGGNAKTYYDLPFLSPEYIAVRSVLVKNGFVTTDDEIVLNELVDNTKPQLAIIEKLHGYIGQAKTGEVIQFSEIYDTLKKEPYGLRDGYLAIVFATILNEYKKSLIITSHSVEQELSAELIDDIVRRPDEYTFTIVSWDKQQLSFLDELEQVYSNYINKSLLNRNRLKAIYEAMFAHYKTVAKFARTTDVYVSAATKKYRSLLEKTYTNYSQFIFTELKAFGDDYDLIIEEVQKIKYELENALNNLSCDLVASILKMFNKNQECSLAGLLTDLYQSDWKQKKQKSFDYYTNAVLELTSNLTGNETDAEVVAKLSKVLTGFELLYWNDKHKTDFLERLCDVKEKLDAYVVTGQLKAHETKMVLTIPDGTEKTIVFDTRDLSNLGKTLKNKINTTFGNFAMSVSYEEKVQILLSLMEDLIEGK